MSKYKLNINFTEEALKVIYSAHQRVALTKAVQGNVGKSVIWVATLPFERNMIEWEENYMLYSSREEVQNGASIKKLSDTTAIDNVVYEFDSAIFQNAKPSDCVSANEYAVHNAMDNYESLTFGLAQEVKVNGQTKKGNPINALTLPYNHTAVMAPVEKVRVFLANSVDDGIVMSKQFSNAIEVEFRGGETEKTITYDCEKGMFIPAANV
ncbi:MAG: hypothetical protein J6K58_12305 [Lachnospiraceae bacterium]|nr:hypothetical protein [Lachnospiraceae bacterium]